MRALLDTCVLSELRRPRPHPGVLQAVQGFRNDDLFVSVISVGEITQGISLLREGRTKQALQTWLRALERDYADRLLLIDLETCHIWGELAAHARKKGCPVPANDGLIAASARRHGLHVMTRNVADFEPTGALLLNPWVETH